MTKLKRVSAETAESRQKDLELVGETSVQLSGGLLRLQEPSFKIMRKCRMRAAQWAITNRELATMDPTLGNWEFVAQLVCACTIHWAPTNGPEQIDLNMTQFEEFTTRDFRKVSDTLAAYGGNED